MPRVFTGLVLPQSVIDALAERRQPLPGARWVEPENLHLTLRFAGDISRGQADDFAEALGDIIAEPFELEVSGLGLFGGRQPRSIWAGVTRCDALEALAIANERAARRAGLDSEARRFRPHITLARLKQPPRQMLSDFIARFGGYRLPRFVVEGFVLYSSRPRVGGGPYVIEARFPLAGVADFEDDEAGFF